ncbi:hypothetical protein SteCoe_38760 [Stentor coeruleus]|uniref:TPX2 C-terminal domain-containing protein n=1 Tax=Stentor coeruleus TaxID=5963 RepID=A0A1R2AL41_9CILI|nr:hypothetical protein SteCoe_38760 [Stentor coeruleus]
MENFANVKPTKRKFIPSFDTAFGDRKRELIDDNVQKVLEPYPYPHDWESRLQIQAQAGKSEETRNKLLDSFYFDNCPKVLIQKPNENHLQNINKNNLSRSKTQAHIKNGYPNIKNSHTANQSFSSSINTSTLSQNRSFSVSEVLESSQTSKPKPFNLSNNFPKNNCSYTSSNTNEFIAREMPDFSMPFVPKLGQKQTTKTIEPSLYTECRADRREIFNEKVREKQRINDIRIQSEQEERRKRDDEEIKMLRKHMEFKARPFFSNNSTISGSLDGRNRKTQGLNTMLEARTFYRQ